MKIPEIGDLIVTRNGKRWICATSETIREKVGIDPSFVRDPIKAHSVDGNTFMTWTGNEPDTDSYGIAYVFPANTIHQQIQKPPRMHSELIKAWADGADVEWFNPKTNTWKFIVYPTWREDTKYRIKTTKELVCHINSDGEIISVGSGNLSLTFNNLGELISAEVIKK